MKTLNFSTEQVTEILAQIAKDQDGFNTLMRVAFEALMRSEREVHNDEHGDKSNGYRNRRTFGQGRLLELRVPRTRNGNFYPFLLSLIKDQEEECRRLAFSLYGAGMTTEQVGELFDELYGRAYSKSSISNMFDYAREEVQGWLLRPLEAYYPIIYIDATFLSVRRGDSVSKEAFYTVLGVRPDRTREVLAIVNMPQESATGWREVLQQIKSRGVKEVGLVVSDALSGLEDAVCGQFSGAAHQLCTVHLSRNILGQVRSSDKPQVAADLKEVFKTSDSSYTPEQAWQRWQDFTKKWGKRYGRISQMGTNMRYLHYFTYLSYDSRVQSMIYTTNWIERLNRDYKRVTRMRGALPNPEAAILLLGRVAMTRKAYDRKIPKLDYENQKFRWES